MKLKIAKGALLRMLAQAARVADRKSTMPILSHLKIAAAKGALRATVSATNLQVSIEASDSANVSESGDACVDAKRLFEVVSKIPGGDDATVDLSTAENAHVLVKSGKIQVRIAALAARDFPKLPATPEKWGKTSAARLKALLDRVSYATSEDESRMHLACVGLSSDGAIARAQAVDGHRAARASATGPCPSFDLVLLPRPAADSLAKLLGSAEEDEIGLDVTSGGTPGGARLAVLVDGTAFVARLHDGAAPPIDRLFEGGEANAFRAMFLREDLLGAAMRSGIFATATRGAKVTIESGKATITGVNPETGDIVEEIEAACEMKKPALIGISGRYLVEALEAMGSDAGDLVEMRFGASADDTVFLAPATEDGKLVDGYRAILAQMRM